MVTSAISESLLKGQRIDQHFWLEVRDEIGLVTVALSWKGPGRLLSLYKRAPEQRECLLPNPARNHTWSEKRGRRDLCKSFLASHHLALGSGTFNLVLLRSLLSPLEGKQQEWRWRLQQAKGLSFQEPWGFWSRQWAITLVFEIWYLSFYWQRTISFNSLITFF